MIASQLLEDDCRERDKAGQLFRPASRLRLGSSMLLVRETAASPGSDLNPGEAKLPLQVGTTAYGAMVISRPCAVRAQITVMSRAMMTIDHTG